MRGWTARRRNDIYIELKRLSLNKLFYKFANIVSVLSIDERIWGDNNLHEQIIEEVSKALHCKRF